MSEPLSSLARIQQRFAAALLTGGDYPAGLFRGDPALSARRFALYRGNLTANWEKALGNAYPVLRLLVGGEFFRALAREFGRARPLAEGDLNAFGAGLAEFLAEFEPLAAYPYMPDLARLEWALHLAHYEADEPALGLADLSAMDAERLSALTLRPTRVSRLLQSPWDIAAIWEAHQDASARLPAEIAHPSRCLVCRPRWRAEVLRLGAGEYDALVALQAGAALGDALAAGAEADPTFAPGAALPRWIQARVFAADSIAPFHNEDEP